MTRVRIDRLEEDVAVLVWQRRTFDVPRALLPEDAAEGDSLDLEFHRDAAATEAAREATQARRARLSRDDDGGDFSL